MTKPTMRPVPIDAELQAARAAPFAVHPQPGESPHSAERRRRRAWHIARRNGPEPLGVAQDIGGVRCRVHSPAETAGSTLLWLHGGGWTFGEPEGDEQMLRRFATEVEIRVVAVDYRLAPEHPYPAALDDAWAVFQALCADGPVIVAGASAGATLAAGLTLRLRDEGHALPSAQILICPPLDNEASDDDDGPLRRSDMDRYWSAYLQLEGDQPAAYAVPARAASLAGLPATSIWTTSSDPLRMEGWRYAQRLAADGVEVQAHFIPGGYHGFEYEAPHAVLSQRATEEWIEAVRAHTRRYMQHRKEVTV